MRAASHLPLIIAPPDLQRRASVSSSPCMKPRRLLRAAPPAIGLTAPEPNASSLTWIGMKTRSYKYYNAGIVMASSSGVEPSSGKDEINKMIADAKVENSSPGTSFLAKIAIALGIAASITLLSALSKSPGKPIFMLPHGSSESTLVSTPVGFTFTFFGNRIVLPEQTPGWVYFWLLMAAGCGLFISEEALNVWVGITLGRTLSLDGSWESLANSFSSNASYIISTVLWVYWGVCISDLIPFYLGKLFRQTKASQDISTKLGVGKEKATRITRIIQRYGNLIGFVERFSLGVRNPTAFLAGAWGISPECFFAGVCCGGLITLPIQLFIGILLRERPMVALASVATVVGIWTVFPYLLAASTALFLYIRRIRSS